MQFSTFLAYSITIVTYALLVYHFLRIVLFNLRSESLSRQQKMLKVQQVLLCLVLVGMLIFHYTTGDEMTKVSIIPWIWGFLAGHVCFTRKKRLLNELLGFGMLLAMTIILFFKQTEIIQFITQQDITHIITEIHLAYIVAGFVLGMLLWTRTSSS